MKKQTFTNYIKDFDFETLFNELGWDTFANQLPVAVNNDAFMLKGVAQKKGFVILLCPPLPNGKIPVSNIRKQIENKVSKNYFEHLIIYADQDQKHQIWQLAVKEENKPKQVREVSWYSHQDVEGLFQRMKNLLFTLDEEETITIVDVGIRIREGFAKNSEQVTKKFYTEFKKQHVAFLDFIEGIDDHIGNKENQNKQWYASLMLNRLMFCYFIQKKGFLDQDLNYLQNKLRRCEELEGQTNFYSFYRSFLLELFHDGLGKPKIKRKSELPVDLGKIPYLNGGLFDVHELERQFDQIEIDDDAFKKIFNFFDQWNWHLDSSIEATGKDINPDVIGYIFEKYINDRAAMGAYYTKEDITDYIGKNTIIPFLFDETERHYKKAFKPEAELWQFLKESGNTYIYDAVKHGIPESDDLFADLPEEVQEGINHPLEDKVVEATTQPHLWELRQAWNQKTPTEIGLPTEIYRELIERRKRYADIKAKIEKSEINHINDFITYNLNIRQFTQDFIENSEDAAFIRHFYKAINKITILDPTCGSGAFLFAALNILEPLYEACIIRMEQFVAEQPGKHKFFEETLAEVKSDQHPSLQYFIFKSIILNNLYGVDIMNEAVEIAKLRLFLKLVATVDVNPRKDNFGLEPLPDIDFNIRAGNTLIGFATENELLQTIQKKEPLFAADKLEEFKEEFELVSKAFGHFQNSQLINDQGSDSFKQAKAQLVSKLKELNHKLNVYLATNYGIDAERKPKDFEAWLHSHQPFHWFAEFYQIVAAKGGFDCIVGNPPYVQTSDVEYKILFEGSRHSNLYAYVQLRCNMISNEKSYSGLIVPMSISGIRDYSELRTKLSNTYGAIYITNHAIRPQSLFEGISQRVSIVLTFNKGCQSNKIHSTKYLRTKSTKVLFEQLEYSFISADSQREGLFPKLSSDIEVSVWNKINSSDKSYSKVASKKEEVFFIKDYGETYWVFPFKFSPYLTPLKSFKELRISSDGINSTFCFFNSTAHYFFYSAISDCWHFGIWHLNEFPYTTARESQLSELSRNLEESFKENRITRYDKRANGNIYEYKISKSKPIIDQIDTVLAEHYGFTEAELDFIINYDIKYRMGKALFGEADESEEDED
ncbi:hypothetical protein OB69_04820 [Roseivirga seohaensis subsp. aquiponti]|uniref:site-specific DNA-methyltransferase (adenine-specific) n=1 Tax=Roseivirga seohaensis subsp. aquiponti TaxID=1566026 RepID=A0A0L8AN12_9BACT|nr:DNA methyltransferase [Roseivirga seohaensis]KOF03626.1 hypothetical protein OB69_04820 [Roseivirga seohaensis subsp. aquiponti]